MYVQPTDEGAEVLTQAIDRDDVEALRSMIAWGNKENFQRQFVRIRDENRSLSPGEVADLAIRETSFGDHRIKQGFSELSVDLADDVGTVVIDGVLHEDVPGALYTIDVKARRPSGGKAEE